jgi:ArsR family transcriptional regulator
VTATQTLDRVARVFHALSDPTRLRILSLLERGERCVCELTDALDAAQSRLSFHLKMLKEAGLVIDRKEGRWVYYRLDPEALEEYGAVFELLPRTVPKGRSAECCT